MIDLSWDAPARPTSAYVTILERDRLRKLAERSPPPQPVSLRQRFEDWYGGLPEFARHRRFSMSEIEVALKNQGKHISKVLLEAGWQRKRIWSTTGHYHRYWVPPGATGPCPGL
jgi:hypothetical protein